ncbi:winged helix-turn-helix transcriptional regulator [Methanospirillum sp. J.3.6.1-F.2.7.3]|jgi:putative transcriptional regulator|uniref:Winged helix-turn-helix transcriptional regulator n=1 Tax=Methanospirillum purgamenti TaxID=2834276 RepID=A0A8E7EK05_9EURY|nr:MULTISPECIES: winged helix-turn-helix transcriptional regulator [Methanospirillum]MDX8549612.1 winged helix-turn-helix transcriptional regulator [Methanospirillum hungatei]NLW76270.1 winged helix-turn-helix transcriptional regulator [Methanomicrobiales archaeon]QVV88995.1 winged helix-turn-helix transcriptional regulator [Methanospirillum sp. J.3.6.1-F.2.7.3]
MNENDPGYTILKNKRDVTRFQILVDIAAHQPAIRQQEIAAGLGVTPQAISDYVRELTDEGMLKAPGRGRYEVTREGVEWILHHAEVLESYARHIRNDVIKQVSVWTAIAAENLTIGDSVGVYMKNGLLYASKQPQSANGMVVSDTPKGEDAGVSGLEGIITHRESTVFVCKVPRVERGGSRKVRLDALKEVINRVTVVACVGLEAWVSLKKIDRVPDLYFGSREGAVEAALHGIPCAIVIVDEFFTDFLKQLEQADLTYEIHDLVSS